MRIFVVALAAVILSVTSCNADDDLFTVFDWTPERMVIELNGIIEFDTPSEFRRLSAQRRNGLLILRSDGGDVMAAASVGEMVRKYGWSTIVPMGGGCYSACAVIWAAGVQRRVGRGATIGFHAPFVSASDEFVYQPTFRGEYLCDYFQKLGYSAAACAAFLHPPPDVFVLTPKTNEELGIGATFD